jgi:hypothetical protein
LAHAWSRARIERGITKEGWQFDGNPEDGGSTILEENPSSRLCNAFQHLLEK